MAYKVYSTTYLMKLTKAEIIDILRTAEHNYIATEEALTRSADYGKGLLKEIEQLKKADVQPVRRGRWIDIYEYCEMNDCIPSGLALYYWCSECMEEQEKTSDFCQHCGADMRQEENEKEG